MSDDLQVHVVRSREELDALGPRWEMLFEQTPATEVYQSPTWISAWYRHFESRNGMYVVTVRRDGDLVGLAPFSRSAIHPRCGPQFLVSASVEHIDGTVGGDPLLQHGDEAVAERIARHLGDQVRRGLTVVSIRGIRLDGPFHAALEHCVGVRVVRSKASESPMVDLVNAEALERRVRHHRLPRRRRRLEEKFATVQFDRDDRDVVGVLDDMGTLLEGRWPDDQGPSLLVDDARRRFSIDAWSALLEQGRARFVVLRVDGHRAAVQLVSRVGTRFACEVIAYDNALREFALGHLVMSEALQVAAEESATTVDLRPPRSEYKDGWADGSIGWASVTLVRPGHHGRVALRIRKVTVARRRRRLGRSADEAVPDRLLHRAGMTSIRSRPHLRSPID